MYVLYVFLPLYCATYCMYCTSSHRCTVLHIVCTVRVLTAVLCYLLYVLYVFLPLYCATYCMYCTCSHRCTVSSACSHSPALANSKAFSVRAGKNWGNAAITCRKTIQSQLSAYMLAISLEQTNYNKLTKQ